MKDFQPLPLALVLGLSIEAVDMDGALRRIAAELQQRRKGYVCLAGVHGVTEARRDPSLAAIYSSSAITLPDGAPTAWVGRWQGHKHMRRVAGPELMLEVFRRREFSGYTHFLYGGEPGVAEELARRLTKRFPGTRIVGTFTPPFRELSDAEGEALIGQVRESKPDIIWVGISTPKQERFMHRYLDQLDTTLMFGVGAAFDFHTGRLKDAPNWIKKSGMQWLHRLLQDPRRLWRRYLRSNTTFLWHISLQLLGIRDYSTARAQARNVLNTAYPTNIPGKASPVLQSARHSRSHR